MDAKVYTRQLSGDDLARLLAVLRPRLPFAILERVDDVCFPAGNEPLSPADWPQGRAFGPSLEVRWEPKGAGFHTLLVGDQPPSAHWTEQLDLTGYETDRRCYYLWGPGNVALGRDLAYRAMPPGSGRPQLVVIEYRDPGNGRLIFARHVEMGWEGQI